MKRIHRIGIALLAAALPTVGQARSQAVNEAPNPSGPERFWTGTVTTVRPLDKTITAKSIWLRKTFNVGNQCQIISLEKEHAVLGNLVPGDHVRIAYGVVRGVPVADAITQTGSKYTGTVKSVSQTDDFLTMRRAPVYLPAAPTTFRVASDCKITLAGVLESGPAASLYDVQPGDQVTIIYDFPHGRPVVYRIQERTSSFTGTVKAVDLAHRTVRAKNNSGEKRFVLAADCRIAVNGKVKARLRDVQPGLMYRFTYEDVMGVNVLDRITEPKPLARIGPFNAGLSVVNSPR